MRAEKTLLYPFSIDSPYFEGYAWAVELARRMKARLQLYISTSPDTNNSHDNDALYHSLLEADGYYLQHYLEDGIKLSQVKMEPFLAAGELKEGLIAHLRKNPIDIVILDPSFSLTVREGLKEIVKVSRGVILLSNDHSPRREWPQTPSADYFYDNLRNAELHKLPRNFFITLGKDHAGFNYLRKFFSKNRH